MTKSTGLSQSILIRVVSVIPHILIAMIVVTQTAGGVALIEVPTSLLLTTHGPVVTRKFLIDATASTLHIAIVRDEVTELAGVSTLHQSRAGAGLVALDIFS